VWSNGLYRISSPSARLASPQDSATAFSPAVAPGVNTISSAPAAPMNLAAWARTPAMRCSARVDHGYEPRPGLAAGPASVAVTASMTARGFCVVAALSR